MAGAIQELNPIKHVQNTFNNIKEGNWQQAIFDPGDAFGPANPEEVQQVESEVGLTDTEMANLAATEAKRKQAKAKSGTKTVLTSPLGATTSAQTAVTKLGGA